jgi:CHAD domain-containing protein
LSTDPERSIRVPETKYHLKKSESPAKGFERILREQIELAVWNLSENARELDDAVHEARKAMKRARSTLRLLRSTLGEVYRHENAVMRGVGRKLTPARDAQALIEIFDDLVEEGEFASVRQGLMARKDKIDRSLSEEWPDSALQRLSDRARRTHSKDAVGGRESRNRVGRIRENDPQRQESAGSRRARPGCDDAA